MKRVILLFLLIGVVVSLPIANATEEKPLVIATTSVLGSIVNDLAGEHVDIVVLVNPTVCPGHYDVRPSDVLAVSHANLILYHGFEPWLERLVESSGTSAPCVKIQGSWNTPEALKNIYTQVAAALDQNLGLNVSAKLEEKINEINSVAEELQNKAEEYHFLEVKVITMEWQRAFVEWLGFQIVDSYGPPEKLSAEDVSQLEMEARENNTQLIIDNLQSGTSFGESLAGEVGAVHVVLSNFPGIAPGVETPLDVMKYNVEKLIVATELSKEISEKQQLAQEIGIYQMAVIALSVIVGVETLALGWMWRRKG